MSRNYNYTVSITLRPDSDELIFRDITGSDLELLDRFFAQAEPSDLTFEDILCICQWILVSKTSLRLAWRRDIMTIWSVLREEIFINYTPKLTFLKIVCALQHGRFVGLMEDIPMSKLITMVDIYQKHHDEASRQN